MLIFSLSSLFQRILGVGLPVALQVSVTFAFSLTIASDELCESSIFGGTKKKKKFHKKLILKIEKIYFFFKLYSLKSCQIISGQNRDF